MSLIPGWLKKRVVEHELDKLEEKQPMIRKILDWLTDPQAGGRKRSIALGAALVSGACRGIAPALKAACAAATIAPGSAWCQVNPEAWALVIETVNGAVQVIQPGMDFATVAFAVVGFIHARQKAKAPEVVTLPAGLIAPGLYGSKAEVQAALDKAIAAAGGSIGSITIR